MITQESIEKAIDKAMEKHLTEALGPVVAKEVKEQVLSLRMERLLNGNDNDATGLTREQKIGFVEGFKSGIAKQANLQGEHVEEAFTGLDVGTGASTVATEVFDAILVLAGSHGHVAARARQIPMRTNKTQVTLEDEEMEATWANKNRTTPSNPQDPDVSEVDLETQDLFPSIIVHNDLVDDASVDIADYVMSVIGRSVSKAIDRAGFAGPANTTNTNPFTGLLNTSKAIADVTLAAGTSTSALATVDELLQMTGEIEDAAQENAAFYFSPTVWAKIQGLKGTDGHFLLPPAQGNLTRRVGQTGPSPRGQLWGYDVYTSTMLPAVSTSAQTGKKRIALFTDLYYGLLYGFRKELQIDFSRHVYFLNNQTVFRGIMRCAIEVGMPKATAALQTK